MNKSELLNKRIENYYLVEKEKKERRVELHGYPYWLTIDPTNFCNLRCLFCPTGQRRMSRPQCKMTFEQFKIIIDKLGMYLIHIDLCNWGEPFLNEEIFDMVLYAKRFLIHIKIDTNFTIFDEEKAEKLLNSGLDKIILSIDGASRETYPVYRVGGDFDKVIKNIKILVKKREEMKKNKPFIEWQFLVFRHNEHEIEKARKLAEELGVDTIGFTAPYVRRLNWLSTLEPFRSKHYEIKDGRIEFKKNKREIICNWLWDGITINSDTSISPCCSVEDAKDDFFSKFPENESIFSIWNSKKYIEARKHVLEERDILHPDSKNICLRCDHIGWSNHMDVGFLVEKMKGEVDNE